MKKVLSLVLGLVLCCSLVGCGGGSSSSSDSDVSGKVSLNGSTSMEKFVNALTESITEEYPNLKLEGQFTGSSAGLEALQAGTSDIGDSSRALTDEEKKAGLVENIVALDGIAIITHKDSKVKDLTTDQLKQIYTGAVTNWKDLGGEDEPIVVIGRESGSGTRGAFEEILKIEDKCKYASELNETGAVLSKVAGTKGAIGYVSLDVVDDTVTSMKLDGVKASNETVLDGTYTLQRPFVMATKGKVSKQNKKVQAVFKFIKSDAGKKVIESAGLVAPEKFNF